MKIALLCYRSSAHFVLIFSLISAIVFSLEKILTIFRFRTLFQFRDSLRVGNEITNLLLKEAGRSKLENVSIRKDAKSFTSKKCINVVVT